MNIVNQDGYKVSKAQKYHRLDLYHHDKKVWSYNWDGSGSDSVADYDLSVSSPPILAICKHQCVSTTTQNLLVDFYELDMDDKKEPAHVATHKMDGAYPTQSGVSQSMISFVDGFKLAILFPESTEKQDSYKLSVIDLMGMRTIKEVELKFGGYLYDFSVNKKYIGFMGIEKGEHHYFVYSKETLKRVSKFVVGDCYSCTLTMDSEDVVIAQNAHGYEVFSALSGTTQFSISGAQIKVLAPAILRDMQR